MKTLKDLIERADLAIDHDEHFIYDVAADSGQIVGNVKHMHWFRLAVADWISNDVDAYSHLIVPWE